MPCDRACRTAECVQVLVARVVSELARSHADGGGAIGVGCRREGGRVFLVARARSAAGGHRCELAERATRDRNVGLVEGGAGLRELKADGLAAGERAAAQSLDFDGGGCGVARGIGIEVAVVVAVDAVVLNRPGGGATGACDRAFDLGVGIGCQVCGRHVDAEEATAVGLAGEGLAVDGQRDGVIDREGARDVAVDGDVARGLAAAQHVVGGNRVDRQRRDLARVGGGLHLVGLRCSGCAATGAGDAGLDGFVGIGLEVCTQDADAVVAIVVHQSGVGAAIEHQADHVTLCKGATGKAAHCDGGGGTFALAQDVVQIGGDGLQVQCGFSARGRRRRGGVTGIKAVVLNGLGQRAAAATDAAVDLRVAVGREVGRGHVDAVAAIGCRCAAKGLVVDREGDHIACSEFASDLASDGDGAGVFCSGDDVVRGDRVDRQRGLRDSVACFERVVLRGGGFVAAGGADATFDLGVGVCLEVRHGHGYAVAAVSGHHGSIGLAVEGQTHHVACTKLASDLAGDGVAGGALFSKCEHVVRRNRIDAECGFETGVVAVGAWVAGGVARRVGGLGTDLARWHGAAGFDAPVAAGIGRGGADHVAIGVLDHNAGARLGRAADGVGGASLARIGHVNAGAGVDGEGLTLRAVHEGRVLAIGQRTRNAVAVVAVGVCAGLAAVDGVAVGILDDDIDAAVGRAFAIDHQVAVLLGDVVAVGAAAVAGVAEVAAGGAVTVVFVGIVSRRRACAQQPQRTQQRKRSKRHDRSHRVDLGPAQRHVDRLPTLDQLGDQARHTRVFGDVFVETTVFGLTDHAVVARRHLAVVALDDQAGLVFIFEEDVQVIAHALGFDVVRAHGLFAARLLQLVLGAGLRLDAHRLTAITQALLDVEDFVVVCFAVVDEDFVLLGHGDLPWV